MKDKNKRWIKKRERNKEENRNSRKKRRNEKFG